MVDDGETASTNSRFSVDTHLFRELGELLVGRDSTALIELIKNSYDADARVVTISGENLSTAGLGTIVIADDGNGMDISEFERGFLTIASRSKEGGSRRSKRFERTYTGAKGVGRLAAHKLAEQISVLSLPYQFPKTASRRGVEASIDWLLVEEFDSIDEVDEGALQVEELRRLSKTHGTEITLRRVRRAWTERQKGLFLREVAGFQSPDLLDGPSGPEVPGVLFTDGLLVRDATIGAEDDFEVRLEGEFAIGDDFFTPAPTSASWVIEVDASPDLVKVAIIPTDAEQRVSPDATTRQYSFPHPLPAQGPSFNARILIHEGAREGIGKVGNDWPRHLAGIRVYMEGFRVLPYGDPGDDWLSIDMDYKRRTTVLSRLQGPKSNFGTASEREAQSVLSNGSYLGSVFLTERRAPELEMLVNREGFVPSESFDALTEILRISIDLSTRTRAAASLHRRSERREKRSQARRGTSQPPRPSGLDLSEHLRAQQAQLTNFIRTAKDSAQEGRLDGALEAMTNATDLAEEISDHALDLASEQAMLRVLASLGTQMSAFVHEVNSLLALAQQLEAAVDEMAADRQLRLRPILQSLTQLRRGLERQASYLLDVVTLDARRRRSAQPLHRQFESASSLVMLNAARRDISVSNFIPENIYTPPMFRAEVTALVSNLLTNAVKNAGSPGAVQADAEIDEDKRITLWVQNTGSGVALDEAERWFNPFESTSTDVDAGLGQGMGLGLPITRALLADYGGTIRFAAPSKGFATAVEVVLPRGRVK